MAESESQTSRAAAEKALERIRKLHDALHPEREEATPSEEFAKSVFALLRNLLLCATLFALGHAGESGSLRAALWAPLSKGLSYLLEAGAVLLYWRALKLALHEIFSGPAAALWRGWGWFAQVGLITVFSAISLQTFLLARDISVARVAAVSRQAPAALGSVHRAGSSKATPGGPKPHPRKNSVARSHAHAASASSSASAPSTNAKRTNSLRNSVPSVGDSRGPASAPGKH